MTTIIANTGTVSFKSTDGYQILLTIAYNVTKTIHTICLYYNVANELDNVTKVFLNHNTIHYHLKHLEFETYYIFLEVSYTDNTIETSNIQTYSRRPPLQPILLFSKGLNQSIRLLYDLFETQLPTTDFITAIELYINENNNTSTTIKQGLFTINQDFSFFEFTLQNEQNTVPADFLINGIEYELSFRTINSCGSSPFCSSVLITCNEIIDENNIIVPTTILSRPTIIHTNTNTVTLQFDLPSNYTEFFYNDNIFLLVLMTYQHQTEPTITYTNTISFPLHYHPNNSVLTYQNTINDLFYETTYVFSAIVSNQNVQGTSYSLPSESVFITRNTDTNTNTNTIPIPTNLQINHFTGNSISFTFSAPENANLITEYFIEILEKEIILNSVSIHPFDLSYTFHNLIPGHFYTIRVYSKIVDGSLSIPIEINKFIYGCQPEKPIVIVSSTTEKLVNIQISVGEMNGFQPCGYYLIFKKISDNTVNTFYFAWSLLDSNVTTLSMSSTIHSLEYNVNYEIIGVIKSHLFNYEITSLSKQSDPVFCCLS